MSTPSPLKRSPLTQATVTPPSLNRQHSHNAQSGAPANASSLLASLRTRTGSPGRTASPKSSQPSTPSDSPQAEHRTSWEDCKCQRDGYISFPDFDQLKAKGRQECADRQ
ncbi:hypothetical protein LTR53_012462 [Teratosphaeriaceae sp. CCFEE 6253]|nr:hypothetical protein LTR53_012462 [Teratosphaeriaceae sp. CCFEE 6253]